MAGDFWRRVLAAGRTRCFALDGSPLLLRVAFSDGEPDEAWLVTSETQRKFPADKLRLFLRGDAITLKVPVEMSGQQWTPRAVLFGSTYEGGQSPDAKPAVARDEWLDRALARMLAEFR